MSDRAKKLERLVVEALGKPAEEGLELLQHACADDPEMLSEALAFLQAEELLSSFLEESPLESMRAQASPALDESETDAEMSADTELTEASPARRSDETSGWRAWQDSVQKGAMVGPWKLGPYQILKSAGSGGMGHVYVAEDPRLGRRIALKTLSLEHSIQAGWLQRFEKEARILAAINHPNIVTIHSIEEADGVRFLTMELVDGETLAQTLPEKGMPFDRLLAVAVDLAEALGSAHERGVIHRDLKPANLMMTRKGRVKILDFGIAKTDEIGPKINKTKGVMGTVAYMSPEQLGNEPLDARSDLFSLGVVLYQLATGSHPFPAPSPIFRVKAILNDEPPSILLSRPSLPEAFVRIVERLLRKDPDDRFQSAAELGEALAAVVEDLRTESLLETRKVLRVPANRSREAITAVIAVLLICALSATGLWWGAERRAQTMSQAVERQERTRLAVLFFRNLSRDSDLDWLSAGIPELLITDLAQSPDLNVLSAGLVHRIVKKLDGEPQEADVSRLVAEQSEAEAVVDGSFVRLGDLLRVTYTIEDPTSGEILRSEVLEEEVLEESGETGLFALVDRMSTSILGSLRASRPEQGPTTVSQATTSSLTAWQAFAEAQEHLYSSQPEAAIESFRQAIEIDPGFASAWAELSVVYLNLGRVEASEEASRRAFELSDRLPMGVKMGIEAKYYGAAWATIGRAIETYRIGLSVYPENVGWRNNLARRYTFFERYSEASDEFERLLAEGTDFLGTYTNAAVARAALGDFESGYSRLNELAERSDGWLVRAWLGFLLTEWGKLDEASDELAKAAELNADTHFVPYARWRVAVLRRDWERAEQEVSNVLAFRDDSHARWRGHISAARNAMYRGSLEALDHFEWAIEESSGSDRALARCFLAELLLELGRGEDALAQAELARQEGESQWPELRGIFLSALAHETLGRSEAADQLAEELSERWRRQPNSVEERQMLHLQGRLMLSRGDFEAAVRLLERAANLLPPRGIEVHWHVFPDHIPIWADIGRAELAVGRPNRARDWLLKVTESGSEHLEQPWAYVASLYRLGISRHRLSESAAARGDFVRFLQLWRGGDFRPDWQTEAASAVGSSMADRP